MKKLICAALLVLSAFSNLSAKSGKPVKIWKNVPSMEKYNSTVYVHLPDSGTENRHSAVIICPGGSYHHLGLYNEGYKTAEWFSKKGVTAFVLRYRTAEAGFHYPAMLQDLQRTIQLVRENAESYGISSDKIGLIGYSAGGHLVTMGAAFYESHDELKKLGINHTVSLEPDFSIPVYPVVSMQDDIAHKWSRKSLLGSNQTEERKQEFSMEENVENIHCPIYLVACKDDNVVDYTNSVRLAKAFEEKNIKFRFRLYDWGKHGFGMLENRFMKAFHWNDELWDWLTENQLI